MTTINLAEYLENQVFPALWNRLATAFPEFDFVQKSGGFWQAKNKQHSRSLPGSPRASRVYVYRNTPFGFKIQGGEFITWLEYLNGMNKPKGQVFIEIVKLLCQKAGVPFPELQSSPKTIQQTESRERQQFIRETFWNYCRNALFRPEGEKALAYAIKRGFTKKQIEYLELGYYPSISEIKAFLLSKGFTQDEIGYSSCDVKRGKPLGSGLIYDGRWEGRLIGVWRDRTGRIINFWARDITEKAEEHEKYLMLKGGIKNSPYNLHLAHGTKLTIVEGFIDALLPLANGILNVVALGGRLITQAQLESIKQQGIKTLIFCLDNDPEGRNGTEGSLNLVYEQQIFKAFVTDITEGIKDPAQFIQTKGAKTYNEVITQASNAVKWQAKRIAQKHDLTIDQGRHEAFQETLAFSKKLQNPLDIQDFREATERLIGCSFIAVSLPEEKSEVQKIRPIEPDKLQTLYDQCTIEEFKVAIEKLQSKEIIMCQAGTGVGKTFTMLSMMAKLNLASTFMCATKAECVRAVSILKHFVPEISIAMATSDSDFSEGDQETSPLFLERMPFLITTYAYLGRKGHTSHTYKIAKKLLEGRIIFCDEIQELYRRCEVYLPLAARYLLYTEKDGNTYRITEKCPKKAKTGNCSSCHLFFKRKAPDRRTRERQFYEAFPEENRGTFQNIPTLGFLNMEKLLTPSDNYVNMHGTLFYMPLDQALSYAMPTNMEPGFGGYLNSICETLRNGHIRTEFPLIDGKPAMDELIPSDGQIKYPVMPCNIPILCGLDFLPLIQLMTYSKGLVLASATIPPAFMDVVQEVAKERKWKIRTPIEISETPFHFDVTVLKTDKQLSIERQKRLVLAIEKATDNKIFIVTDKKLNARRLNNKLQKDIADKIVLFERQDYESLAEIEKTRLLGILKKIIITYGGSAITRGVDFPDVWILIVDCQQFIPKSGLTGIKVGMSDQEVQMIRAQDIQYRLTQVIGRLLRSLKERIPGQTVQDDRKIIILLHGLPKELWNFRLDPRLVNPYHEYQGIFVDLNDRRTVESISGAMIKVLKGEEPDDKQEQGKQDLIDKAEREGIESLYSKQRKFISDQWEHTKLERKLDELTKEVLDMKRKGYRWNVIYRELHLHRYPFFRDQLKQIFDI